MEAKMDKVDEHLTMAVKEGIKAGIKGKSTLIKLFDQEYYVTLSFRETDSKLVDAKYKIDKAETPEEFFKVFEDYAKKIDFDIQGYSDKLKKRFEKPNSHK